MDFWARRKAAVEAETQAEAAAQSRENMAQQEASLAEKSDEEILQTLGLPEPETLGPEDDFKGFLAEGVPQRLKTRALRCLWRTNPILANVDGLVDYGEDFTDAACVIENMQTAYQVGKGMMAHVEELARQAEADTVGDAQEVTPEPAQQPVLALEDEAPLAQADDEISVQTETFPETVTLTDIPKEGGDLPPRRRMAFTFDETPV